MSRYHWGEFQTHAFHVAPFICPIVPFMNFQGWQTCFRKADQLSKPGNGIVYVWYMSAAIGWANKLK